jgi:signal transduction histidine kinase
MKIKKLSLKMQIALNILFLVVMVPLAFTISFSLKNNTIIKNYAELENTRDLIQNNFEFYVQATVENHLRSISEKTKDVVEYQYNQYIAGEISEEEAYDRSRSIILDKNFGKVGSSGYLAGIDPQGILVIHPVSEGVDASGFDFMKKAIEMKTGYLEYMWKNSGETIERKKAGYLTYFEPWKLIIWASSYVKEFTELIDADLLIDSIAKLTIG